MRVTSRARSGFRFALRISVSMRTGSLAILFACALLLPSFAPTARAGPERNYIKESCSEYVSRPQGEPGAKIADAGGDTWVSWTGTVVSMDRTLWGSEIRVSCSDGPADGGKVILSLDAEPPPKLGLTSGKTVRFVGHLIGPVESGQITIKDVEFLSEPMKASAPPSPPPVQARTQVRPEPAVPGPTRSPSPPADANAGDQNGIRETIRAYYQAVQTRQVDKAIFLYAALKRPNIKRNVLEAIARDTEYYMIDSIQIGNMEPALAKATVELRHKKINKSEEFWEVRMELLKEQGDWRILATPGRRVR